METVFKIDKSYNPYFIIGVQFLALLIGLYFGANILIELLFGLILNVILYLLLSVDEQIIEIQFTGEAGEMEVITMQYLFKKKYILNTKDLRFNYHNHKDMKGKPLEMFFILKDGKILRLTTKLWAREKLILIASTVFGVSI